MKKEQSKNQGRMNSDIRRELIDIIGQMKDPRAKAGLVTITRVEAAPDLSTCKVYVSVLDEEPGAAEQVVNALNAAKGHIRSEVAARMHIRRAPELAFVADRGAAYADRINRVLKDLDT